MLHLTLARDPASGCTLWRALNSPPIAAGSCGEVRQQIIHNQVNLGTGGFRNLPDSRLGLHVLPLNQLTSAVFKNQRRRFRRGLEMELQPDNIPPDLKCLVLTTFTFGNAHCSVRQIEGFAMPVKYRQCFGQFKSIFGCSQT